MAIFSYTVEIVPALISEGVYETPGDIILIQQEWSNHNRLSVEVYDHIPGECASVTISIKEARELIDVLQRAIKAIESED